MSETNNSEKSKNNLESIVNGTNWVALGVVAFAVIGLVSIIFNLLGKEEANNAPKKIIIKYEISVDKVTLKNAKDSTTLTVVKSLDENNKKVLNEINSSVNAQYARMESILSVQEDRSKLFSYGAGFLAILVAIATFFGFKSINEMKKSTIDAAEYEAQKIAEEKAEEISNKVSKEEINRQMDSIKMDLEITLQKFLTDENKKEVEIGLNTKTVELEKLKNEANDLIAKLQVFLDKAEDQFEAVADNPDTADPEAEKVGKKNDEDDEKDEVNFN